MTLAAVATVLSGVLGLGPFERGGGHGAETSRPALQAALR